MLFQNLGLSTLIFTAGTLLGAQMRAAEEATPKITIKDVMEQGMKGGLLKKVAAGGATAEESQQLVSLLTALSENKPPRGDAADWDKRTGELLTAARAAADGTPEAGPRLQAAAKCGACHREHKGI